MLKYKIRKKLILMFINYIVIAFLFPQGALAQDSSRMDASDRLSWQQAYTYGSGWVINSTIHYASYNMAVDNVETRNALEKKLIQKRLQGSGKSIDIKGPKAVGDDSNTTGNTIDLNDFQAIYDIVMNGPIRPGSDPEQIHLAYKRQDLVNTLLRHLKDEGVWQNLLDPEVREKYSFLDIDNNPGLDFADYFAIMCAAQIIFEGPMDASQIIISEDQMVTIFFGDTRRSFLDGIYKLATMDNPPDIQALNISDEVYHNGNSYALAFPHYSRTGSLDIISSGHQNDDPTFKDTKHAGASGSDKDTGLNIDVPFLPLNKNTQPDPGPYTGKSKERHKGKGISSLKTSISDNASLENIIEHLENKDDKTDFEEALLEIAKAIMKDAFLMDETIENEFKEALHLIYIAAAIQELLPDADFGAITNIFDTFTVKHESSYNSYLISTEKIYLELEKILGIDLENAILPDKYKKINTLGPKTKRKILVDLTLKHLSDKNKENLSNSEKKALSIYQNTLLVLTRKYRDTLKKSVDKLILSLNKALANVKPASLAEDKEQFKILFSLGR